MSEKVILSVKQTKAWILLLAAALFLIIGIINYGVNVNSLVGNPYADIHFQSLPSAMIYCIFGRSDIGTPFGGYVFFNENLLPFLILAIVFIVLYFLMWKMEITLTDKRVFGRSAFGRQVDLPLDSVSSVTLSPLGGISVGSSSGRIRWMLIEKKRDFYSALSQELNTRRSQTKVDSHEDQASKGTGVELLKQYKELLDSGILTEDEFAQKKAQILGSEIK